MRFLELRRHTMRTKPGQHLSQAGVTLARKVGDKIGPFARVITSTVPRAFETALAMGYAVDERSGLLARMGDISEVNWELGFAEFQRAYRLNGATTAFAEKLAKMLRKTGKQIPDGSSALLISHGGIIEAATIGGLSDYNYDGWGAACDYCEGVRLHFDGQNFVTAELLRLK